ncbi:hypothetical protein J437_LFUL011087 [Ladona fulva]|uniref:Helitron helicase-like domain-containing protein n=1 Tax=Ladona fulva TaxID=123851 RepID=A0A8K0K8R4_LADFU|nr:hypothetical protein J437_LFUL011087 [Ladona fulva]
MDRHDIITRVFRRKKLRFMDFIAKYHILGAVRCWMYTIEWQERGLTHLHSLIWLLEKICPNQIDQDQTQAEYPNPEDDPELYNIIKINRIHGPRGILNMNSPFMMRHRPMKMDIQSTEDDLQKMVVFRKWSTNIFYKRYFRESRHDPFAKSLLYADVCTIILYMKCNNMNVLTKKVKNSVEGQEGTFKSDALGLMYTVHPKKVECFYL